MAKKILKIVGGLVLIFIIALATIPYFFQDTIKELILDSLNEKVDAKISFNDASITLFKNFPQASVEIKDLAIINKKPFLGDTLIYAKETQLKMSIKELFKGKNEKKKITSFSLIEPKINIIFNEKGIANYDIALKEDSKNNTENDAPLMMNIEKYTVEKGSFSYLDKKTKTRMKLFSINHSGIGNFEKKVLDLNTTTQAKMLLSIDKKDYFSSLNLSLDAILGLDLNQNKYSFKNNKALINNLPLTFTGFLQILEEKQVYDITFKTPSSSFKNFLQLIPKEYAADINDVKTEGDFIVNGFAKGNYTPTSIPTFELNILSNNASFKFNQLPKKVEKITINTQIKNITGNLNDTYINLNELSFLIDKDIFKTSSKIENIIENPKVEAQLNGTINLSNLSKVYPIKLEKPLTGTLIANIKTKFDVAAVEKKQYQNIINTGDLKINNFEYTPDGGKKIAIATTSLNFNPSFLKLNSFIAKIGKTDLNITGSLQDFYGYLFQNQKLKGNFNLESNLFVVSDFVSKTTNSETQKSKEAIKIPAFLDCIVSAKANRVLYDNLNLTNVSGKMIIKDETIVLEKVKTSIFEGQINADGLVSTKKEIPNFSMKLDMNQVNIAQTFTQLDMMQKIAPIASVINGKFTSKIAVSGNLNPIEMTPVLNTISGDVIGQLLSTTINKKNTAIFQALDNQLRFIDFNKLNLNNLKAALTFDKGRVQIKPFTVNYQDIPIQVGGSHGFDQTMNYNINLNVPSKYLGNEVNNLLARLTPSQSKKFEVLPVSGTITGNFSTPRVTTNLKQGTTNLVNKLVAEQKQKLITTGQNTLNSVINNAVKPKGDTTKVDVKSDVKNKVKQGLNSLLRPKNN